MKGVLFLISVAITICVVRAESPPPCCGLHQNYFECKPCFSVPCGTTPPKICPKICIQKPRCYCIEGYREKDGKCVLPCEC
ncbi:hypothetical protein JTB14_005458 [Gonioctena quinquepunctata]|nr:hypothetical protein JTB14_005458 [Gonioctena quinquepunctata]